MDATVNLEEEVSMKVHLINLANLKTSEIIEVETYAKGEVLNFVATQIIMEEAISSTFNIVDYSKNSFQVVKSDITCITKIVKD